MPASLVLGLGLAILGQCSGGACAVARPAGARPAVAVAPARVYAAPARPFLLGRRGKVVTKARTVVKAR
jgi:hypothetical protein